MILSVGYDADSQVLEVELVGEHIHQYADVPELVFRRMLGARSAGAFYVREIRGQYWSP